MGIRFDYILERRMEGKEVKLELSLASPYETLDLFLELTNEANDFLRGHKPGVDRRYLWTMRLMSLILQKHYYNGKIPLRTEDKAAIYAKW